MIDKKPLISIAMACYNSDKFLNQSIGSILNQSYPNWELVVCDDASTDSSLKLLTSMYKPLLSQRNKQMRIFSNSLNVGYGSTLKTVIENSSGELIAILDSDDALYPNALEISLQYHLQYPEASLTYSNKEVCDSRLKFKAITFSRQIKENESYLDLKNSLKISHLKVFKMSHYKMTEGLDSTLLKNVDKDLVLKLEEVGKMIHIPIVLYKYRNHPNNITQTFKRKSEAYRRLISSSKTRMYESARLRREKKNENIYG